MLGPPVTRDGASEQLMLPSPYSVMTALLGGAKHPRPASAATTPIQSVRVRWTRPRSACLRSKTLRLATSASAIMSSPLFRAGLVRPVPSRRGVSQARLVCAHLTGVGTGSLVFCGGQVKYVLWHRRKPLLSEPEKRGIDRRSRCEYRTRHGPGAADRPVAVDASGAQPRALTMVRSSY